MQLTLYTDYALRVLLYLALHPEGATIAEIASRYRVSRNHLVKIAHNLGKLGLLETKRGRNGGLRLTRSPGQLNLGEIVRLVEPNFHIVECFDRKRNACSIAPACGMRGAFYEAQQAFLQTLDRYTLADFTPNGDELRKLLRRRAAPPSLAREA
ncbi:MAG: Rrf2 family transcriptional regulator [Candidatus Hydrogenedentes bacterium]|nr:Rrf2 family transcriptional regulator [Candidatus Hydrogenedentota bacterium]